MTTQVSTQRELAGVELLLVDGDPAVQRGLEQLLGPEGLPITTETDPARALELLTTKVFGVVVVDLDTPVPSAGIELARRVRELSPQSLVFLLVGRKSFDAGVSAFRAGVHDVILKAPDQVEYLKARIVDAAGDWATRQGVTNLLTEVRDAYEDFVKALMEAERRATEADEKIDGRDSRPQDEDELRILFVDSDERLYRAVAGAGGSYQFAFAHTGGEALDQVTKVGFHIVLVGGSLPDLPTSLVLKTLKSQSPETVVISYQPGSHLEIFEGSRTIPLVPRFTAASQLGEKLVELADAHRLKLRERRYVQVFRERHYELLHRLSSLRKRIDRAIEDTKDGFSFTR